MSLRRASGRGAPAGGTPMILSFTRSSRAEPAREPSSVNLTGVWCFWGLILRSGNGVESAHAHRRSARCTGELVACESTPLQCEHFETTMSEALTPPAPEGSTLCPSSTSGMVSVDG